MPVDAGCKESISCRATADIGESWRTFVHDEFGRTSWIDQDLGLALFILPDTHLRGNFTVSVTMDGEFEVVTVLVPEDLPQQRNAFAIVDQQGSWVVNVLNQMSAACSHRDESRAYSLKPPRYVLKVVVFDHGVRDVPDSPVVEGACGAVRLIIVESLFPPSTRV